MLDANAGLLNARGGDGESAAMLAVYYGKKGVLELLLGRGAELNIFEAAAAGKMERVVALLAADPSLAKRIRPGWFPAAWSRRFLRPPRSGESASPARRGRKRCLSQCHGLHGFDRSGGGRPRGDCRRPSGRRSER